MMALFLLATAAVFLIIYLIKYVRFSMPDNFPPGKSSLFNYEIINILLNIVVSCLVQFMSF